MTAPDTHPLRHDDEPVLIVSQLSPPRQGRILTRSRLLAQLDRAVPGAIVLLTGEPAAGKTALVVDWLGRPEGPPARHAWLTVPAGLGSDDGLFWRYVLAAVEPLGVAVDDLRDAIVDQAVPGDQWLTALANRLDLSGQNVVIVVDDLQELQSDASHAALRELLDRLPRTATAVIMSRVVPPWSLSAWRMSGRLIEIRSDDLRLRAEEVDEFLRTTADLALDAASLSVLTDRTEGWVGGVKLASLSIGRAADPSDFIARFAADDELVSTYLFRNVLEQQERDVRSFLLDVSILDELSADLCDAVRGRDDSESLLLRCRTLNLFLVELTGPGRIFRLHSLFAELLRARLSVEDPERAAGLHRAASRVFEDRGDLRAAIRHAAAAGDEDRLNALMGRYTGWLAEHGFFDEIAAWIPELRRRAGDDPAAVLGLASALSVTGSVETTLLLLDELLERDLSDRDRLAAQQLQGFARMARGDVHLLAETAAALARMPASDPEHPPPFDEQRIADYLRGVGSYFAGDLAAADAALDRATRRRPRPCLFYVESPGWQGLVAAELGRLDAAERFADESDRRMQERGSGETAVAVPGLLARAAVAWERDRLEQSREHLVLARRCLRPLFWESVLVGAAESRLPTSGGPEVALARLEEIATLFLGPAAAPPLTAIVAERAVDLNLRLGRVDAAQRWSSEYEWSAGGPLPPALALRLAEAMEEPDLLTAASSAVERPAPDPVRIDTLLAAAHLAWTAGTTESSRRWVAEAARLAEPHGLVRRFLEAGAAIREILADLVDRPAEHRDGRPASIWFVAQLARACSGPRGVRPPPRAVVVDLVEQPSAREIEVLQMLDRGLSYTDIGAELFVSRNTVKTHVRHLYTKMGVSDRAEAIDAGRRIGLL